MRLFIETNLVFFTLHSLNILMMIDNSMHTPLDWLYIYVSFCPNPSVVALGGDGPYQLRLYMGNTIRNKREETIVTVVNTQNSTLSTTWATSRHSATITFWASISSCFPTNSLMDFNSSSYTVWSAPSPLLPSLLFRLLLFSLDWNHGVVVGAWRKLYAELLLAPVVVNGVGSRASRFSLSLGSADRGSMTWTLLLLSSLFSSSNKWSPVVEILAQTSPRLVWVSRTCRLLRLPLLGSRCAAGIRILFCRMNWRSSVGIQFLGGKSENVCSTSFLFHCTKTK